ncbi:amidohydrolase [Solicola sp. PLA-1-18]|uniref:amidohydrolase n=1 Tax=Solicola sp. PLA-1-18 TaxID=3380532 RepID=UPI003B7895E9
MPAPEPRVLLRGGHVLTPGRDDATALAVEGGTVRWVGRDDDAAAWTADATEVVELDGALVTPGFVDAHVHLASTGLAQRGVDLTTARSGREALDLLTAHVRAHGADVVVIGHGWDDSTWPDDRPTRAQLDHVLQGRIGYLSRIDSHSALVSSSLVDADPSIVTSAGWRDDGWVERDAHHRCRLALDAAIPATQRREAIGRALGSAAAAGLVSVHELGAPHLSEETDFAVVASLLAERPLPEVVGYWGEPEAWELAERHGLAGLAGDLCCDGAVGSRTAALLEPYADDAGSGHLYLERDEVAAHVVACTGRGLQAGFHVIGDAAVATVLAGFADAAEVVGLDVLRAARHRLEHLELVDVAAVAEVARLGLHASVQPCFDSTWGGPGGLYERRLGTARALRMNPFAELAAAGVPLAFGSDAPVTPFGAWPAVRAAVEHRTPGQGIGLDAAIAAHTVAGWRAARRDDGHGVLAVGHPASYAVWDAPEGVTSAGAWEAARATCRLPAPVCRTTVHDGRVLHDSTG